MSFEDIFVNDAKKGGMGAGPYLMSSKPRPNMSRIVLDADRNARYVELNGFQRLEYGPARERYLAAINLTYDAIITVYNINSRELGMFRFYAFDDRARDAIGGFIEGLHKPLNLEVRLIGFQTGQEVGSLGAIADFLKKRRLRLVEADLFGNNVRHVSVDSMLGMDFEVLLENRVYRPGELKNTMTLDQFLRAAKA